MQLIIRTVVELYRSVQDLQRPLIWSSQEARYCDRGKLNNHLIIGLGGIYDSLEGARTLRPPQALTCGNELGTVIHKLRLFTTDRHATYARPSQAVVPGQSIPARHYSLNLSKSSTVKSSSRIRRILLRSVLLPQARKGFRGLSSNFLISVNLICNSLGQ